MSDREIIIGSLQRVQKQIHRNALIRDLSYGLALFLVFPVAFKIADFFVAFRARTVIGALLLWLVALAIYIVPRSKSRATLASAAASLDKQAALKDEMKTAYWFVTDASPEQHSPDWVALQVRRAAQNATKLDVRRLYPRVISVWSYASIGLIALLIGLNFAPISGNHNWLAMQAGPALNLTPQQQALLNQTKKLLERAKKLDNSAAAEKIEKFISDLEGGKLDPEQAISELKDLQNSLDQEKLDVGQIDDGLNEIAQDLESSKELSDIANELENRELADASSKLESLGDNIKNASADDLKQMAQSLEQAGQESRSGLQDLAKDLSQAGASLQKQDPQGMQSALNQAAKDIKDLENKLDSQAMKDAASQSLQNLQDSLKQQQGQSGGQSGNSPSKSAANSGQKGPQNGTQGSNPNSPGQNPDQSDAGDKAGDKDSGDPSQDGSSQQKPGGQGPNAQPGGLMTSGTPHAPLQLMGDPTKLSVQLEKEQVEAQAAPGGTPETKDGASGKERSTLDYRNVPSDLTPGQKDVLNQDKIPWEYRNLIKSYFQAIRPGGKP